MYNSNTKILVTGGAGFVGTNFINDLLNRGHDPDCIAIIDNMEHGTYIPKVHDKITNFHRVDIRNQFVETIIEKLRNQQGVGIRVKTLPFKKDVPSPSNWIDKNIEKQ